MSVAVRRAGPADYATAEALHVSGLPGEFLSSLGVGFLTVLYRGFNAHPDGILLVAERDGAVVGFVSGATNSAGVSRDVMRRHVAALGWWAGWRVLTRPRLIPRVLEVMRHREDEYATQAELQSIAAAAGMQGGRTGSALLTAFQREMRGRGVAFFHLIVAERNTRARAGVLRTAGATAARTRRDVRHVEMACWLRRDAGRRAHTFSSALSRTGP